jgi:prostaglandin reductase 3
MIPATYRKIVTRKFSRNFREATEIVSVPMQMPGPGQILVKNYYAGVNASDVNIAAGVYPLGDPPFDMGVESSGEVVAVGEGVTNVKVGDHVLLFVIGGGYREYLVTDAAGAYKIPGATAGATALMVGALTARVGMYIAGELKSGETILITAAAGGVGSFAVQYAKLEGNYVIGTTSTEEKAALLHELGCDRVIVYTKEDVASVLKKEYPEGIDFVFESVGIELFDAAVDALKIRGRMVINGYISEYNDGAKPVTQPRMASTSSPMPRPPLRNIRPAS